MKKSKDDDKHLAAKSGARSEKFFKETLVAEGFSVLKTEKDFKSFYEKESLKIRQSSLFLDVPKWWQENANFVTKKGKKAKFHVDAYLPEFDLRVEIKYTKAFGTTEEKVMYDLEKIRDGVYSDKKLLYVFFGPIANEQKVFRLFKAKMSEFDPNEQKVKVIIDDSEDLTLVKKYLYSLR